MTPDLASIPRRPPRREPPPPLALQSRVRFREDGQDRDGTIVGRACHNGAWFYDIAADGKIRVGLAVGRINPAPKEGT